ncbi:ribosome biogenesis GTPase YlqF [Paenibacillus validus]|uniref:Ribosome biogenesis GTPase A n=1 Tax=Paenibacillus validus TaxID=44253 RepID=A0A7X3CRS7_9BACL|nr:MULTISPECIES: ribosome biogenesis GTPase YlqF [Paenibacillus]MED4603833.1 ribosome biogenesis GTPase YlqF [Paenibacillus validus]MED4608503.1 ribosome biogenesis GTPase YlqF [Paenibacillus validus]MUG70552.1 ribosome biogenesis GTPase YlqF [Paenibacillus validus]
MTIQWFPGHMTRARRQIQDKLKLIDLAIELLDARIPLSSRNPMIDEILQSKPRLVLLNKSDLADPEATRRWVEFFADQGLPALPIDAVGGNPSREILLRSKQLLSAKIEAQIRKGMNPRAIRALIVGIPNVGKSTLINKMAGRKVAATGDKPGVTKGQQWIKVGTEMELLDTPGILWPKFEDQTVGFRLAATGAIKEEILQPEEIALFAMRYLVARYPAAVGERFGVNEVPADPSDTDAVVALMEAIGRKRGALVSGGRVDLEKASLAILRELRAGKLGRITLEMPDEVQA